MSVLRSALTGAVAVTAIFFSPAISHAALVHPAGATLAGITVTPNNYTDSFFSDVLANYGDATVLTYVNGVFSGGLVQIGLSTNQDCGGSDVSCIDTKYVPKSGTYTGAAANVFAVHTGGNQGNNFWAFQFATAITSFSVSGFSNGVSFIRAYCSLDSCDGPSGGPGPVPVPGTALLFGSVLAGGAGFGAWRRRRKVNAA